MSILFFLCAGVAFLAGFGILHEAKSAIHEIEAFMLFLIGTVFLSGAGLLGAVTRLRQDLTELVIPTHPMKTGGSL
jgi:hypothetical protein